MYIARSIHRDGFWSGGVIVLVGSSGGCGGNGVFDLVVVRVAGIEDVLGRISD